MRAVAAPTAAPAISRPPRVIGQRRLLRLSFFIIFAFPLRPIFSAFLPAWRERLRAMTRIVPAAPPAFARPGLTAFRAFSTRGAKAPDAPSAACAAAIRR
jgi:hypothetical protein